MHHSDDCFAQNALKLTYEQVKQNYGGSSPGLRGVPLRERRWERRETGGKETGVELLSMYCNKSIQRPSRCCFFVVLDVLQNIFHRYRWMVCYRCSSDADRIVLLVIERENSSESSSLHLPPDHSKRWLLGWYYERLCSFAPKTRYRGVFTSRFRIISLGFWNMNN